MKAYLNMSDIRVIYTRLRGTEKGMKAYLSKAKSVATKSKGGAYIFMNEAKLFEFLQDYFGDELTVRNINSFGELMQYIS